MRTSRLYHREIQFARGGGFVTSLTHISGYAHVAERYGFEEAVFLDAIVFWYRTNKAENRNFRDGRWWTYNSIKAFEEVFPVNADLKL